MITTLMAAGQVREDDDKMLVIQGLSLAQAEGIADWLAIATGGKVFIRHMSIGAAHDIERSPEDVAWHTPEVSPVAKTTSPG